MKQNHILDIGYQAVQQSGKTNMMNKKNVQYWANELGFFDLVLWLEEASVYDYISFQNSIDFSKPIDLDIEYLLELDSTKAMIEVRHLFESEVDENRKSKGFKDFYEIPFTLEEFLNSKENIFQFLLKNAEKHPLNYLFVSRYGKLIGKFKNNFYHHIYKAIGGEIKVKKIDARQWKELSQQKDQLNPENRTKFNVIDEEVRMMALFA